MSISRKHFKLQYDFNLLLQFLIYSCNTNSKGGTQIVRIHIYLFLILCMRLHSSIEIHNRSPYPCMVTSVTYTYHNGLRTTVHIEHPSLSIRPDSNALLPIKGTGTITDFSAVYAGRLHSFTVAPAAAQAVVLIAPDATITSTGGITLENEQQNDSLLPRDYATFKIKMI